MVTSDDDDDYECYEMPIPVMVVVEVESEAVFEATIYVKEPDILALISAYDWDVNIAYAILMAESNGSARAYNPEWHVGCQGSIGLFQIACLHEADPSLLFDSEYNVRRAYEIYRQSGWTPWGAYSDKRFLEWL